MNFKINATENELKQWIEWLITGDTGVSSETFAYVMLGVPAAQIIQQRCRSYPHDSSDFARCCKLLEAVPSWRKRIGEMTKMGKVWSWIADNWSKLEELYIQQKYEELYSLLNGAEERLENDGATVIQFGKKAKICISGCGR
jgi:hypothetical protein